MKNLIYMLALIPVLVFFSSCSSSEETAKTETAGVDSVYVFDKIPADTADSLVVSHAEEPAVFDSATFYIVQIGAFTTKDKAEVFADLSRKKLSREVVIIYSNTVNLFVVQLTDPFDSRTEAEKVREELWETDDFKDAWILTVTR